MSELTKKLSGLIPHSLERRLRTFRDIHLRKYSLEKLPEAIYNLDDRPYKISFCTTCMNRLFHLRHTIRKNILDNKSYPQVEFVLLNYNSQDGLDQWVRDNLYEFIESEILNYYHTREPEFFHASIAKNIAHKLAEGDIVCNLDGDNYTGKDFAFYINHLFKKNGEKIVGHFRKDPYWGTEGRIVYFKKYFMQLGGHDESFFPTGHEDHDLLNRAKAFGLDYYNIEIENFLQYLSNTTKEKSSNFEDENADYYSYESANRNQSNRNIEEDRLVANEGKSWGVANLKKNFSDTEIQIS